MDLVLALHHYDRRSLSALPPLDRRRARAMPTYRRPDWAAGRVAALTAARLLARTPAEPMVVCVSHRDGRGAAVAARSGRVGVDLDRAAAVPRAHLRYFAGRAERLAWRGNDPTALWVLKEAVWKALRLGPAIPFTALHLELAAGRAVFGVRYAGMRHRARAAFRRPWPGYLLAVVRLEGES